MFWQFTVFFLRFAFSFTNIQDSQDSRGRGSLLFDSSLPLPPASQIVRHQLGSYCKELTSVSSQQTDSNRESLIFERKSLSAKLRPHLFTEFQYRFHLPQVKPDLISSLTDFVNELPHKLTNNLKLWILEKWKILGKLQNWMGTKSSVQSPLQK